MKEKVTILVLTYNRLNYLKKLIKSIDIQTNVSYNLIILDNHSTDDTYDYLISENRFNIIRHEFNIGGINNLSYAFEYAKKNIDSDYFMILHDDDELKPNYLEYSINKMDLNNYAMISYMPEIIDENSNLIGTIHSKRSIFLKENEYIDYYFKGFKVPYICCPSVFYRTNYIKKIDFKVKCNAGPALDQIFWIDINKKGSILISNKNLYRYRYHKEQDSYFNVDMINKLCNFLLNNYDVDDKIINIYKRNVAIKNYNGLLISTFKEADMNEKIGNQIEEIYKLKFRNYKIIYLFYGFILNSNFCKKIIKFIYNILY